VIPVGEYLPDLPALNNPGATIANNVIPTPMGYRQLGSIAAYSTTPLTARCQGVGSGQASDGVVEIFAGDATTLYRLTSVAFGATNTGYTTSEDSNWAFMQFGDTMIATNHSDVVQKWTLGTSTSWSALGGSPPKARHIGVVRGFVMLGDLTESGTNYQNRIRWSGLDNAETWAASQTTQSDHQDFVGNGGSITGIVGGEFGIVMLERSIFRLDYQGTPLIFSANEVSQTIGTRVNGSIAALGRRIFFWSDDGFYMMEDGSRLTPIGANKVDTTFENDFDSSYATRVTSTIDPVNHLYIMSYPGSGHTAGTPNKLMIYDWVNNRWSTASFDHELITRALTSGYTLEGLDAVSSSIDSLAFSLDSRAWVGGSVSLAAMNTSHNLCYFTGTGLTATVETSEYQPIAGRRSFISRVRPVFDGTSATVTVQMAGRNLGTNGVSYGSAISLNGSGDAPTREDARYHRTRINIAGGFDHVQGVDVTWKARGKR
jgi:hypothetical protein